MRHLHLSFCGFEGCQRLVALLRAHHALVVEVLHTGVGLPCDVLSSHSLLHQVVGTLYLFLACSLIGQIADSLSGALGGFCHFLLSVGLRDLQDGKRVADMDVVAFLDAYLLDARRQLTTDTIVADFHLALDDLVGLAESEETDDTYDSHCC